MNALPTPEFWRGRRVLLTGHTGFKGAWLTCWLRELGAEVLGVSLPEPPTTPSLWTQLGRTDVTEIRTDITQPHWSVGIAEFRPEVVLHLAAQSLVPVGHAHPALTFNANVGGTVAVLELLASLPDLLATLIITTDKVYDPRQQPPHDETHFLGGLEPYSASKAAAELAVLSWPATAAPRATARAGNVIGGGDWAADRLLPDLVRAWQAGEVPHLRAPQSVRPWQHVLEPLRGYLVYVEALAAGRELPPALNLGPSDGQSVRVEELAAFAGEWWHAAAPAAPGTLFTTAAAASFHETVNLTLDSRLAAKTLGWTSALDWKDAVVLTLEWYRGLASGTPAADLVSAQLASYTTTIKEQA
ncbi:MAG: CDP-glucose 4,6-dehydratase [Frankiales bacterium]|jgi:CDP-glucose 4,6-dehydratase|nr:CDP-glucose 4,6-dehydratase [Frankiales bacterium]